MKKISLLLVAFFIFSIKVNAQCTSEELNSLMKEVGQVTTNYTYNEKANTFKIDVEGLSSNIYVNVINEGIIRWDVKEESSISNLLPGKTYILEFISGVSSSCFSKNLTSKSITLPFYNQYYSDELCKGHETYELCKKFVYYKVTSYDEFKIRLNNYIKGLKKEEIIIEEPIEKQPEIVLEILKFLEKYYLYITLPIIIVGLTAIILIKIKKRKESVL